MHCLSASASKERWAEERSEHWLAYAPHAHSEEEKRAMRKAMSLEALSAFHWGCEKDEVLVHGLVHVWGYE